MEDIFFNTDYTSLSAMLTKISVFFVTSGILLYVIYFLLSKLLFRKSRQRKELSLRLTFLWALLVFFIVFNMYLFALFFQAGIDTIQWTDFKSYLGIIAQLLVFTGLIIFFFIKRYSLKKIINDKSIN
jgi:surface polysaccharide O-acyltransferase-like enzyme